MVRKGCGSPITSNLWDFPPRGIENPNPRKELVLIPIITIEQLNWMEK